MKRILHILLFVLPLLACRREEALLAPEGTDDAPDGRVTVTFSMSVPADDAATKALGEDSQLEDLYLAVYGSTGGYKEYIKAEQVGTPVRRTFDFGEPDGEKEVDTYVFKASLQLSNTARTIHFIGNGPAPADFGTGRANVVLPDLLGDKETGFWQMLSLPGIFAAQDEDGNYLNPEGHPRQAGEGYMVSPETQAYFVADKPSGAPDDAPVGIALIRNWAKIILRSLPMSTSHFTPKSFAVINVPKKGTLVPYGGKKGFIPNYQSLSFTQLNDPDGEFDYPGNLPDGIELTGAEDIPSADDFININAAKGVMAYNPAYDPNSASYDATLSADSEPAVYLYERPVPNDNLAPSYVIVYGTYKNPEDTGLTAEEKANGVDCFYKVDLMAGGEYFPVYRNFRYQIVIQAIASKGYDEPEKAAKSAGSADVSADVNASHLADISDGTRRMAIQYWLSKTFIHGVEYDEDNPQLFVVFYDNINLVGNNQKPRPNLNASSVWFELNPDNGVILTPSIGPAKDAEGQQDDGFRPIYFGVATPGDVPKTQTMRVYCKTNPNDTEESPLYRDIVVTVQPRQPMKVVCKTPRVNRYIGQEQVIEISIPDGLVESMFPLFFLIEPKDMTLTPDSEQSNMPVELGRSMADPSKPAFHFIRTLTWDEYKSLILRVEFEDESRWRPFYSYFKTNCEYSGTTVYVSNEYFHGEKVDDHYEDYAHASFIDYRTFKDPKFTTSIPISVGAPVGVSVGVQKENGVYHTLWMDVKNLTPPDGVSYDAEKGMYYYQPTQDNVELTFHTNTDDGDVAITFTAENGSYADTTLTPWRFSNVGLLDARGPKVSDYGSNVAFGYVNDVNSSKNVYFGYCVDTHAPVNKGKSGPKVTLKNMRGFDVTEKTDEPKAYDAAYTGREDYHELILKTGTAADARAHNVSFTLSSVGFVEHYLEAGRFNGDIRQVSASGANVKQQFSANANNSCYFNVAFDAGTSTSDGLVLERGGTYTMNVNITGKNGGNTNCQLFYVQVNYQVVNGIPKVPLYTDVLPDGCTYSPYMGNNKDYVWSFPKGCKSGTLTLRAPSQSDIVITDIGLKALELKSGGFIDNPYTD